jgi:hypothetical protein
MGPNSIGPVSGHSNASDAGDKADEDRAFEPEQEDHEPDPELAAAFVTPSPIHIDPDLLPVAPALILNALALTPVDRSGGRSPQIRKSPSWIQNENAFPVDGFVAFDPKFNFSLSKFPKPVWPKTSPTIPTSFLKDHRSRKKVKRQKFGKKKWNKCWIKCKSLADRKWL